MARTRPTRPLFSSYPFTSQYATTDCDSLAFKPKLGVKVLGGKKGTKRKGHPAIQAVLTQKENEANTAYTALTLPKTMLLDNSHFKTICTRVQLAAQQCPAAAQYGTATATSPLLSGNLSGPVYLVSSSDKLPNLVADLRGQVNIQLRGVVSSVKGAMKTTFPERPGCAGQQVRPQDGRRQQGPDPELEGPLQVLEEGQAQHEGAERQAVQEQQVRDQGELPQEEVAG